MEGKDTILVVGLTSYLGSMIVRQLLDEGKYNVRGSVRNMKTNDKVEPLKEAFGRDYDRIEIVEANLTDEESLYQASKGVKYVIHVASPVEMKPPKDPQKTIGPAVSGVKYILNACKRNGVERIVITSTIVTAFDPTMDNVQIDEDSHADIEKATGVYQKSKILQEEEIWKHSKDVDIVTVHPGMIVGPTILTSHFATSEMMANLMKGKVPRSMDVEIPWVDIGDCAKAHLRALEIEPNQRIYACEGFRPFSEITTIMWKEFRPLGYKLPKKVMS